MIALVYILFFGYAFVVVGLGELVQRIFKIEPDITRKIEHILTAPVWLLMYFTIWPSFHVIIISIVGTTFMGLVTFTPILKSTKTSGLKSSYGVFYFGLSSLIITIVCYYLDSTLYPLVGISYFTLSLADGFAPLVARLFKNHNYQIRKGKSIAGCSTVIIISFLVILIFKLIFNYQFSYLYLVSYAVLIFAAEYYGYKGLDNIFIMLIGFGYLLLEYYGLTNMAVQITIITLPFTLLINSKTKSVTEFGIFVTLISSLIISYCSGIGVVATVLLSFMINLIAVKVVHKIREKKNLPIDKHKTRKTHQIIANYLVCTICSILAFALKNPIFNIAAIITIVEEFADSMASDLGRYCKNKPLDIIRFKVVESGLSGGVSWLGTLIALVSCFAVSTIGLALQYYTAIQYIFVSLLAFLGMIIDSILGSLIQVKYKCVECDKIVEEKQHCGKETVKYSGLSFVNNSMVNFLSSLIIASISVVLFITKVI